MHSESFELSESSGISQFTGFQTYETAVSPEKLLKILIPGVHTNTTEPESIIVSEPEDTCLGTSLESDTFTRELEKLRLKRAHDLTTDHGKVC